MVPATAFTIKEHHEKLKNVMYYPHFEVHPTNVDNTPATIMEGDYVSITFHFSSYAWKKDGQTLYGVNLEMGSVTKLQKRSIATSIWQGRKNAEKKLDFISLQDEPFI